MKYHTNKPNGVLEQSVSQPDDYLVPFSQATFLARANGVPQEVPIFSVGRLTTDAYLREVIDRYTPQFNGDIKSKSSKLGLWVLTSKQYVGILSNTEHPVAANEVTRSVVDVYLGEEIAMSIGSIAVEKSNVKKGYYFVKAYPDVDSGYQIWKENDILHEVGFGLPPLPESRYAEPSITMAITDKRRTAKTLESIFSRSGLLGHSLELKAATMVPTHSYGSES